MSHGFHQHIPSTLPSAVLVKREALQLTTNRTSVEDIVDMAAALLHVAGCRSAEADDADLVHRIDAAISALGIDATCESSL